MKSTLTIDLESSAATIRRGRAPLVRVSDDRRLQFLVRLAFAERRDGAWVTDVQISELAGWRDLRQSSVGKLVARELDREVALRDCISSDRITRRWMFSADVDVHVVQDDAQLRTWLTDCGMAAPALPTTAEWLTSVVRAQIAFHRGEATEAVRAAASALDCSTEGASLRVSALLLIRAEDSRGRFHEARERVERRLAIARGVDPSARDAVWGKDPLGLHCQTRLASMEALRGHLADAAAHTEAMSLALRSAKKGEDLSREAIVYNTLGVVSRREGNHREARFNLADAIALSMIVNDLFTLGGAIFNLALTDLMEQVKDAKGVDAGFARALLTLSMELDQRVGIGRSSAQAEILLARLVAGAGEFDESERLIGAALAMVQRTENPYDHGCLLLARAELTWARWLKGEIPRDQAAAAAKQHLDESKTHFEHTVSEGWDYADKQLARLEKGDGVSLPWRSGR